MVSFYMPLQKIGEKLIILTHCLIRMIKGWMGEWENGLEDVMVEYFNDLFKASATE